MLRVQGFLAACVALAGCVLASPARATVPKPNPAPAPPTPLQETGFLNRTLRLHGVDYHFQVYLPEQWRRNDHKQWPVILYLHGLGERGSEGMWQTQIGLPEAVRNHPDRWPFIIVMPQCPVTGYWTDPAMLAMAIAALNRESAEFHGDPAHTYLTGISLGGYGAWELVRLYPHRWAAIVVAASGIFWSYDPERWQQAATLPAAYARVLGHTPVWLFHGSDDDMVPLRESELMFQALKASGGSVRLWIYQGLKHDCWTRAYNEPDLPRWLLDHRLDSSGSLPGNSAFSEQVVIPLHPPAIHLTAGQLDDLAGSYGDPTGRAEFTVYRQGDRLFARDRHGIIAELAAESPLIFFDPNGSTSTRITFERDAAGRIAALVLRDDRHRERWDRLNQDAAHEAAPK